MFSQQARLLRGAGMSKPQLCPPDIHIQIPSIKREGMEINKMNQKLVRHKLEFDPVISQGPVINQKHLSVQQADLCSPIFKI